MPGHLPDEAAAVLERGGQVVTASARAARALASAYAERAGAQGQRSWRAPSLNDWESWSGRLYERLQVETATRLPVLLTPLQEEALWLRVQREDAQRVVAPHRLARLAMEAHQRLWQYGARAALRENWDAQGDAGRFVVWIDAFERECARLGAVSLARRDDLVAAHIGALALPADVHLIGFDRITPSRQHLLTSLESAGVSIHIDEPQSAAAQSYRFHAGDTRQEMEQCALWVRELLEQDPGQRIAILAPQLERVRYRLDRAFRRVLLPESSRVAAQGPLPWEFSLGLPLAQAPLVAAALTLLRWLASPLDAAEITGLLLGGFLASDAEESRAMQTAEVTLRERGLLRAEMSLPALLSVSHTAMPASVHERLTALHRWFQAARRRTRDCAEWAEIAAEALRRSGWPGRIERGSMMYQAQEVWEKLLDQTAMLSAVGEFPGWSEYLSTLRNAAAQQLFSEESSQAPVQVMGIAESSGQTFDAVWTINLTEERWPTRGRPHPLLPLALQRAHGMPHADVYDDTELALLQLQRIAACAPLLVWSDPAMDGEVEQRPSPTLANLSADTLAPYAPLRCEPKATLCLQEELRGVPWPLELTAGGSEVLKQQAACGFQSFARARLRAAVAKDASWGLDAGERAVLLHAALERLWSVSPAEPGSLRLHSLEDLHRAIETGEIEACVADAVAHALARVQRQLQSDAWAGRWLALESERLQKRILFWLDVERQRAPFQVTALEQRIDDAEIYGLRLRLRLDRADALADDSTLLLDYKTSDAVRIGQWEGMRPDEPQLPIYALYGGLPRVTGVAFAQVRAGVGKTRMLTLAEAPEQLAAPAAKSASIATRTRLTPEIRDQWQTALRSLAQQFLQGDATVDPLHGDRTCSHCGLYTLCRIRSQANRPAAFDEEDSDA